MKNDDEFESDVYVLNYTIKIKKTFKKPKLGFCVFPDFFKPEEPRFLRPNSICSRGEYATIR